MLPSSGRLAPMRHRQVYVSIVTGQSWDSNNNKKDRVNFIFWFKLFNKKCYQIFYNIYLSDHGCDVAVTWVIPYLRKEVEVDMDEMAQNQQYYSSITVSTSNSEYNQTNGIEKESLSSMCNGIVVVLHH